MTRYIALVVIVAASLATGAQAHEARPGYLELRETASGRYDMLWKGPARGELRLKLDPVFPKSWKSHGKTGALHGLKLSTLARGMRVRHNPVRRCP